MDDGARAFGASGWRLGAESATAAGHEVLPLRQCTKRLPATGTSVGCVLAEMGRCGGPCMGNQSVEDYALVVEQAAQIIAGDSREVVGALCQRMSGLSGEERYEDAGAVRDRLLHLVRAAARTQRLAPLANSAEIIAARPALNGGWEIVCVRYGRLAGTPVAPLGAGPRPSVQALGASTDHPSHVPRPAPAPPPTATQQPPRPPAPSTPRVGWPPCVRPRSACYA